MSDVLLNSFINKGTSKMVKVASTGDFEKLTIYRHFEKRNIESDY